MPKKVIQKKLVTQPVKKDNFRGYVRYDISNDEKERFVIWADKQSLDEVWGDLERLVDGFYKVSFKFDAYGGGTQTSLTCADETNDDLGLVLTARAPDLRNAVMLLLYKHLVLLKGEWSIYHDATKKISEWG